MLLQDLNLASQTVLEGLNGLLDHRGSVFLPELGREVFKHSDFRVFGCQSPASWGEGRRGLPGSFLNRFLKVGWEGVGGEEGEDVLAEGGRRREVDVVGGWRRREGGRVGFGEMKRFVEAAMVVGRRRAFWMVFGEKERTTEGRRRVREYMEEVMREEEEEEREKERREEGKNLAPFVMADNPFPPLVFLNKYRDVMPSIEAACLLKYPVIFTGISGSGKSTLVKFLGDLNKRRVHTIGLNASTDVSDLIGAFEQLDHSLQTSQLSLRFTPSLLQILENCLKKLEPALFTPSSSETSQPQPKIQFETNQPQIPCEISQPQIPYEPSQPQPQIPYEPSQPQPQPDSFPQIPLSSLEILTLKQLFYDVTNSGLVGVDYSELLSILPLLSRLEPYPEFYSELTSWLKTLSSQKSSQNSPKFIWLESELLGSLRKGDYLCLDQLHLSNPAVLSRLSPILREGQSKMMVHELDEEVRIHPEFRVFMLSDSKVAIHGKLAKNSIQINLDYRLGEARELEIFKKDLYLVGKAILPQSRPELRSILDAFVNFHLFYYEFLAKERKELEPIGELRLFSDALSLYIQRLLFFSENPLDRLRNTFRLVYQPSAIQHNISFHTIFQIFLTKGFALPLAVSSSCEISNITSQKTSSWDFLGFNAFSNRFSSEIHDQNDILSLYLRNPAVYPTFPTFLPSKILQKYQQLVLKGLSDLPTELFIEKMQALLLPQGKQEYLKSLFIRLDRLLEKGVQRYKETDLKVSKKIFDFRAKTHAEVKIILEKGQLEHDRVLGGVLMMSQPGLLVRLIEYLEEKIEGGEIKECLGQVIWKKLGFYKDMAFNRESREIHLKIAFLMGFEGGREGMDEGGMLEIKAKGDFLLENGVLELSYLVRMLQIVYFEGTKQDFDCLLSEIEALYIKNAGILSNFTIKIVDEYDYNRVLKEIPVFSSPKSARYCAVTSPKYSNLRLYLKNLVLTKHQTDHNYPHFLQIFQSRPNHLPYQVVLSMLSRLTKPYFDLSSLKRQVWRMTVQDMRVFQALQPEFIQITKLKKDENILAWEEVFGWFVESLLPGYVKEGDTRLEVGRVKYLEELMERVEEEEPAKPILVMLLKNLRAAEDGGKTGLEELGWILLRSLGFFGMNKTEKWLMSQGFELEFERSRLEEGRGWLFAKWRVFEEFGRLVDLSSGENQREMEEVKRIWEGVKEVEDGTVYRSGGQFGLLYEEFCRFNGEFLGEVKGMVGKEGVGRDERKRFRFLVENWVREGGRRFFFAFQDVLMPIYVAFEMILRGMEGGEQEDEEEEGEGCVFFKEKTLDELEGIKVKLFFIWFFEMCFFFFG